MDGSSNLRNFRNLLRILEMWFCWSPIIPMNILELREGGKPLRRLQDRTSTTWGKR
jgi:hypothetical protein